MVTIFPPLHKIQTKLFHFIYFLFFVFVVVVVVVVVACMNCDVVILRI